ncbi:MAG: 50S ribosomal L9 C-terminal domain-containing protein, partial [Planctomycetota bacterium]
AARRTEREGVIGKLEGVAMTLTRACNDQGHLYGSVTQQDISGALTELGFPVAPREVRIAQTIKRVGQHEVLIKFDADLEATIALHVEADRELEDEREEMEFDNEGNLIEKRAAKPRVEEKAEEKAAVAEG